MQSFRISCLAVCLAACGDDGVTTVDAPDDGFDRTALISHLATNVLLPIQAEFAVTVADLPAAIEAHCAALEAGTAGTTLESARTALAASIDAWQLADAVLVGPAAMDQNTLRTRIYSWPNLSSCLIDRDVATRWTAPASYDVNAASVNARSLTAIEFLLHPPGSTHNCLTAPTGWDAMGADLPRARCRLAHAIAVDVAAKGAELHTAWRPDGGDYVGELIRAGTAGSSIPSAHAALNLISDAMFYVDEMVKDMKLGEAAGIAMNACGAVQMPCVREVELYFSDRSSFAIRANLDALRRVFTGTTTAGPGLGFDDFMIALGQQPLADRMTASLDDTIAKARALPDSFLGALGTHYGDVVATHAAVKLYTDDLKSQFLTVLSLEIPDDVAADND